MKQNPSARGSRWPAYMLLPAICCLALLFQPAPARTGANGFPVQDDFKVTTVYFVRHAEKEAAPPQDPALTEAGKLRSQELARILAPSGIKTILTTQFLRTKLTAEPLAKQLGITPRAVNIKMNPTNPRQVSEQSVREIVDRIYERAGEGILVVGHTNTIPDIIKMLGGDPALSIDEKRFDDLFIVTLYGKGKAKVAHLKYGSPG
ncbi:MAG TPA: phosphoglycerate mutase family protein [Pyrinomonadaceae bacterium]|jgi:phosphohistidine phosphatase SixA